MVLPQENFPHKEYTCCLPPRPLQLNDRSRGFTTDHGEAIQVRCWTKCLNTSEVMTLCCGTLIQFLPPWEAKNCVAFYHLTWVEIEMSTKRWSLAGLRIIRFPVTHVLLYRWLTFAKVSVLSFDSRFSFDHHAAPSISTFLVDLHVTDTYGAHVICELNFNQETLNLNVNTFCFYLCLSHSAPLYDVCDCWLFLF